MKLVKTNNSEWIEAQVNSAEIAPFVLEDGGVFKYSECFLYLTGGDGILFILVPRSSCVLEVHTCISPRITRKISWAFELLKYFIAETSAMKLQTQVAEDLLHVRSFVNAVGFKHEGIQRASFMKNGTLLDLHNYGMTREEIGARLCR